MRQSASVEAESSVVEQPKAKDQWWSKSSSTLDEGQAQNDKQKSHTDINTTQNKRVIKLVTTNQRGMQKPSQKKQKKSMTLELMG